MQFGLDKQIHLAGANTELEVLEGLPPEARIGDWVAEWYHIQPGVPHVDEFVAAIKKKTGRVPTARTWFGFVGTWSCALAANKAKSLDALKMARALDGMELPPEVGLMPNTPFYRANQHQLIGSLYVGNAQAKGSAPDDLFHVTKVVDGKEVAGTVAGIRLQDDLAGLIVRSTARRLIAAITAREAVCLRSLPIFAARSVRVSARRHDRIGYP